MEYTSLSDLLLQTTMSPLSAADSQTMRLYRGLPAILQDLQARPGSLEVVLFWNPPQSMLGVDGFRVFQDNENNLIQKIDDRDCRQVTIKMPSNFKTMFYVCAVSDPFGREGPKLSVLANSNTDAIVAAGTAGATPGTPSNPDPTWRDQPSGGRYRNIR